TQQYDQPLTAERLFAWHASLFPTGRSGMHRITVGAWRDDRTAPMQVVSGPVGRERVHFEAPAAERLEEEMQQLFEWFNSDTTTEPVLKAALAHLWFVTAHPAPARTSHAVRGSGRTLGRCPRAFAACQRSHFAWSVSQIWASQRVKASKSSAVSALTPRLPRTIALRRWNGMFIRSAAST
ncbi:MAG TPA: Fic family protein, partial [Vicinamibacterales bacterium]|nr:Fic family protein [Vicinamibacterales bacterium]